VLSGRGGAPLIPNSGKQKKSINFTHFDIELHYYAPEVRRAIRYAMQRNKPEDLEFSVEDGQAQDMYSFGVILYELLYRKKFVDIEDTVDGIVFFQTYQLYKFSTGAVNFSKKITK
jgi:serine/threonine protein kinase